jgi:hypothetical protein
MVPRPNGFLNPPEEKAARWGMAVRGRVTRPSPRKAVGGDIRSADGVGSLVRSVRDNMVLG